MSIKRIAHDTAFALATSIVGCLEGCLRDEEMPEAFQEVYRRSLLALEKYEEMVRREQARLSPSPN